MIILSFDVGVRNLSYAIIKLEDKSDKFCKESIIPQFEIIDWKNINILKDYSNLDYIRADNKKMSLTELKEVCCFHKLSTNGKLKKNYVESIDQFLKEKKVSKAKYIPSLETLGIGLISNLDKIIEFVCERKIQIDHIILENQPKINFQMRTLQIMIFTYFLLNMNKLLSNEKMCNPHIECVSPSLKSKFCNTYLSDESNLDSYKERKKTSIKLIESILSEDELKKYGCWNGKKDDLSDVIIQTFGYYSKL